MSAHFILILTLQISTALSNYLEAESNYQKPKLERNNIVNKGIWIRNKFNENLFEKAKLGDFIFRENSLDVDNLLQNNFDAFGANYMQTSPFVSAYVERQKRSNNNVRNKRLRKSVKNKTNKNSKSDEYESSDIAKSKIINDLRPSSVFNDYPYEVAILLNNNKKYRNLSVNSSVLENRTETNVTVSVSQDHNDTTEVSIDKEIKNTSNETSKNVTSPKRSMKYDLESEIIKKIEFTEDVNKTDENRDTISENKINDRNVFDKDNTEWHQNVPIPDINVYKVVPKEPIQKSKPVTERGLIKVISMLTKTFKKIMKQHIEIKEIHSKINDMNDEFSKTVATVTTKFQDFDLKYLYLVKLQDKLKEFETKMTSKEEYFKQKDKEIAKNFKEFENQQKKFLQQQKQFYNIQKLMLAQNEKINIKQNLIAKTQSEISHRQNNFARILKKAKQMYIDSRNPTITKLSSSISKIKDGSNTKVTHTSTMAPEPTTDSIKINLFSIPTSNRIQQDPDEMILKEKDDQAIDDLVYKYYFNNTFIDNFMKNKILNSFMGNADNLSNPKNTKNKRNELETTILLPVMESNESKYSLHNRDRRWINHHSKHKNKRRDRGKAMLAQIVNITDEKSPKKNVGLSIDYAKVPVIMPLRDPVKNNHAKRDPFLIMAKSFCNEIGQNLDKQMLSWCIEKALRRLQSLGKFQPKAPPSTTPGRHIVKHQKTPLNVKPLPLTANIDRNALPDAQKRTTGPAMTTVRVSVTTGKPTEAQTDLPPTTLMTTNAMYTNRPPQPNTSSPPDVLNFPDNDELELNLKQYELKPDTEGNVYFEGSIHASDILAIQGHRSDEKNVQPTSGTQAFASTFFKASNYRQSYGEKCRAELNQSNGGLYKLTDRGDSDSQGVDDIMPGLDSNSRVDVDPLAFDIQAKRRAIVRQLNERIRKSIG